MKQTAQSIGDNLVRIGIIGCKHTTFELIQFLRRNGIKVDCCITINEQKAREQKVAGYYDLQPFLKKESIPFYVAKKYNLTNNTDRDKIRELKIDILLVMGWQRLIPKWLLDSLSLGAYGMHGSSKPLPHGRGRSPINWSLIQDKKEFYTHLFQYLPGIDNGPVIGVKKFSISPFDTCETLHLKNLLCMATLCQKLIPNIINGTVKKKPQPKEGTSYYPKRSAEDGIIIWSKSTKSILNLIRAVTHPFPGAFSHLEDRNSRLYIWRAIPFDSDIIYSKVPGEILEVFHDGKALISTGDGCILTLESSGVHLSKSDIGKQLSNLDLLPKEWHNLPD